jgi:hypothetical protein
MVVPGNAILAGMFRKTVPIWVCLPYSARKYVEISPPCGSIMVKN